MKKLNLINRQSFSPTLLLTLSWVTIFCLVACGSDTPFKRGPNPEGQNQTGFKPGGGNGGGGGNNGGNGGRNEERPPTSTPVVPMTLSEDFFNEIVLPMLNSDCVGCHEDKLPDFEAAKTFVVIAKPEESILFLRASNGHANRKTWIPGSEKLKILEAWINGATLKNLTAVSPNNSLSLLGSDLFNFRVLNILENELSQTFFEEKLRPMFESKCSHCHENPAADFESAKTRAVYGKTEESDLFLAASGLNLSTGFKHRFVLKNDPENLENIRRWIMGKIEPKIEPPPENLVQ